MANYNKLWWLLFEISIFNVFTISGFNIDTRYPIIIKNSADGTDSHFGTTVVLINEKDPGVIVGSPRSNSTHPGHSQISEPGVVWQCSFQKSGNNCRVVVMDPTGNVRDPFHTNVIDRKDGGWLGGALAEDADYFIACGSRWQNQFSAATTDYYMNGICYTRPKSDIFRDPLPPVSPESRLLTITDPINQHKNIWVSGQAGFSVHSPPQGHEVLLGSPGVQNWKGSVIRLSKDVNNGNKLVNPHVFNDELTTLNLQNDSYFGFAVASGKFRKNNNENTEIQYVSGAPRGHDLRGRVVLFRIPLVTSSDILADLQGTQIGSYFGSALCVADLNADGWDDLLVGAPLYSVEYKSPRGNQKKLEMRSIGGKGDEGTVFVYLNNKGLDFQTPTRINGPLSWSHFGTAIAKLGDINNDGYDDIAVGAPYARDGSGVVYIYHGASTGILKDHAQEIEGKSLDTWVKGFGYSLSSGKDIDLNGYNDLAIGAYDSGHVVVLRSRPVVSVFGEVRSTEKKISFDATTFEIESCIQYTGTAAPSKLEFTVKIMIDVQSFPKRVFLKFPEESTHASEHTYQEEIYAGQESCTKLIAVVVNDLESTGKPIEIKQTLISIPGDVSENDDDITRFPTFYEITRFGGQVNTRISGPGYSAFCKSCPLIDAASSKTKELVLPLAVLCGDDDICNSDLRIEATFLEIRPGESFILGSSPVLTMIVKIDNFKETAISPVVKVVWNSKTLKKTPPECHTPWSNDSFTEVTCPLGRTLDQDKFRTISLEFDVGEIDAGSMDELLIQISVSTASEVADVNTLTKNITIPFISRADLYIEGSNSSAKFNLETLSVKTSFLHTYEIRLDGPTPIAGAIVNFQIPTSVEHPSTPRTKFDIAEPVTTITSRRTTISCYPESGAFKKFTRLTVSRSMDIDDSESNPEMTEDYVVDQETLIEDQEDEDFTLTNSSDPADIKLGGSLWRKAGGELEIGCNSSKSTVICMSVRCRIVSMSPGTSVTIMFPIRVESSSLKNLFKKSKFSSVKYISTGATVILGVDKNIQPISHKPDTAISVSVIEEEVAKPVSHLIYLLGIFIGFLILALIIYCLYKSGLFNRKKAKLINNQAESESLQKKESQVGKDEDDNDDE